MIIKTADDWWSAVDNHWLNLLDIFDRCGAPMSRGDDGHWWSDGPGQNITRHEHSLIRTLENAKQQRDHEKLHHFFELAWMAAPDRSDIHSWPSWDVLCDLCSENWVFYPEAQ